MQIFEPGKLGTEYYLIGDVISLDIADHMEAIIMSHDEIEVFDPNGMTDDYDFSGWAQKLTDSINQRDGRNRKLIRSYDTLACPQVLSSRSAIIDENERGDCTIWSYYYLYLRIKNPTVPRNEIIYYMQHLPPLVMKMKVDSSPD